MTNSPKHQPQPTTSLFSKVLARIELEKTAKKMRGLFNFWSMLFICSAILLIPAFKTLIHDLTLSGFSQYLKLFFSDLGAITADWQDFALNILESFPALSLTATLSIIFFVMLSLKFIVKYSTGFTKTFFSH